MARPSLVFILCLSLSASSGRGLAGEGGPEKGGINVVAVVEDPVTADEHNGGKKERVKVAHPSHPATSGLTELIQRMTLFSHALNQSRDESTGDVGEGRVEEGLSDLVQRMTLLSHALNLSTTEPLYDSSGEQRVSEGLTSLIKRMMLFSHALNMSIAEPEGISGEERVKKGLTDLVKMMTLFSYALNRPDGEFTGGSDEGKVTAGFGDLIHRMVLFSHAVNMSSHEPKVDGASADEEQTLNDGLIEFVGRMRMLSEALTGDHTQLLRSSANASDLEPREQPCLPPFELIAYRMCILQEMQLKLSWDDAQEFCRERGAELAGDMVVIKTRRFLNDLYGEDGTRSRWPVWVGGRRAEQTWIWRGGQQVPDFLWAPSEPRKLSRHLTPEGQCMILDGYRRFYGASLPCHLRRRFVCQLSN